MPGVDRNRPALDQNLSGSLVSLAPGGFYSCRIFGRVVALIAAALLTVLVPTPVENKASLREIEAQFRLRSFCQVENGYVTYLVVDGNGFPSNSDGTVKIMLPDLHQGSIESVSSNPHGELFFSYGWGLSGLTDPLLGNQVIFTIEVGGVSVTETVKLVCDPTANAPVEKAECRQDVYMFFFQWLGFPFRNPGQCIAFVATNGKG